MQVTDLRTKHLAAFTAALRKHKPEDLDNVFAAPPAERYEAGLKAAFDAGWFVGDDLPESPHEWVDNLTYQEADHWSGMVWEAWRAAVELDPNS